jgi:hypothetical protein
MAPRKQNKAFISNAGMDLTSTVTQKRSRVVSPVVVGAAKVAKGVFDAMPEDKQQAIKEKAALELEKGYQMAKNSVSKSVKRGNKGGGGSMSKGQNTPSNAGYGLTDAPKPKEISLNTGIKPNTYVADFMEAVYGSCVPMSISGAIFRFPTTATNLINNYFQNIIAFDLQTRGQENISWALDLTTFTPTNILNAFNSLASSFQIYFYYASILSYHSNPQNRNKGMILIRNNITPQMIDDFYRLERRLLDTPIPPKLLELLRYLSGTFYSGHGAGSPLIKIAPIKPSPTMTNSTDLSGALSDISSTTNSAVYTIMRRCFPHWTPKTLYDVPTVPFYDDNFKTIFANLPYVTYYNSAGQTGPNVTSDTSVLFYNTFTENLDGAAFALTGALNTVTSDWIPGLIIPTTNGGSGNLSNSRYSYYTNSGGTTYQFYPSDSDPVMIRSRQETYQVNDQTTALYNVHLSGASFCQSVSPATIRESCYRTIDYMMSLDDIKVDARNYHHGRSGGRMK